ncbi:MAG: cupin domain-containing protein [Anaerolineae bacterium]|nr:cupin domain-containing protein [Anaerolineae bacterium]
MHIRNADNVPALESPHGEIVYELAGAAAGGTGAHSVAQVRIPPGKASRLHYHPLAEESYVILEGSASIEVDGERATLRPGDAVAIPPTAVHRIWNAGETDLLFVAVCVPAWTPDNSAYLD